VTLPFHAARRYEKGPDFPNTTRLAHQSIIGVLLHSTSLVMAAEESVSGGADTRYVHEGAK